MLALHVLYRLHYAVPWPIIIGNAYPTRHRAHYIYIAIAMQNPLSKGVSLQVIDKVLIFMPTCIHSHV